MELPPRDASFAPLFCAGFSRAGSRREGDCDDLGISHPKMGFKRICSEPLKKEKRKKKKKLPPHSNLRLASCVHPPPGTAAGLALPGFSSPGPGAPWDRPLPSARPEPLRGSASARGGAFLPPPLVPAARAAAGDHVSAAPQGASAPRRGSRGAPGGAPGPWPCRAEVEVTRIQCGLTTDFGRKVTGVAGADFPGQLFVS